MINIQTQKPASSRRKTAPIVASTMDAAMKIWNEKPISDAYGILDNDLARDNLENDIPMADLQDLQ